MKLDKIGTMAFAALLYLVYLFMWYVVGPFIIYYTCMKYGYETFSERFHEPGALFDSHYLKMISDLIVYKVLPISFAGRYLYRVGKELIKHEKTERVQLPLVESMIYAPQIILMIIAWHKGYNLVGTLAAHQFYALYDLYLLSYITLFRARLFPLNLYFGNIKIGPRPISEKSILDDLTKKQEQGRESAAKGKALEELAADLFRGRGWKVLEQKDLKHIMPKHGDQGLDLILENTSGKHIIVQCKNYSEPLDNTPVQECIAAKEYYKSDFKFIGGAVVTNSTFKDSAKELARRAGIELVDGETLHGLLLEKRNKLLLNKNTQKQVPTPSKKSHEMDWWKNSNSDELKKKRNNIILNRDDVGKSSPFLLRNKKK